MQNSTKRIFVVGIARSGTTLLQRLLSSHSQIEGVNETFVFQKVHFETKSVEETVAEVARTNEERDIVLSYIQEQPKPIQEIKEPAEFLDLYCRALMDNRQKNGYVEKSGIHSFFVPYIFAHIPNAHVIGIFRDPRAIMASRVNTKTISRGKRFKLPKRVQFVLNLSELLFTYRRLDQTLRNSQDNNKRIMILSYEQLVENQGDMLKAIFAHLGLPYEPVHENIAPSDVRDEALNISGQMNSSFGTHDSQTIVTTSVRNWEGRLDPWQIEFTEDALARLKLPLIEKLYPHLRTQKKFQWGSAVLEWFSILDYALFRKRNIASAYMRSQIH